jgi:hypothetical protein
VYIDRLQSLVTKIWLLKCYSEWQPSTHNLDLQLSSLNDNFGAEAALQFQSRNYRYVPKAVTDCAGTRGGYRHTHAIEPARKAADYRYAWWLKFDKISRREEAMLRVSEGFSQNLDGQRPDGAASFCSLPGGIVGIGCLYSSKVVSSRQFIPGNREMWPA